MSTVVTVLRLPLVTFALPVECFYLVLPTFLTYLQKKCLPQGSVDIYLSSNSSWQMPEEKKKRRQTSAFVRFLFLSYICFLLVVSFFFFLSFSELGVCLFPMSIMHQHLSPSFVLSSSWSRLWPQLVHIGYMVLFFYVHVCVCYVQSSWQQWLAKHMCI